MYATKTFNTGGGRHGNTATGRQPQENAEVKSRKKHSHKDSPALSCHSEVMDTHLAQKIRVAYLDKVNQKKNYELVAAFHLEKGVVHSYHAYQRGDCDTVFELTERRRRLLHRYYQRGRQYVVLYLNHLQFENYLPVRLTSSSSSSSNNNSNNNKNSNTNSSNNSSNNSSLRSGGGDRDMKKSSCRHQEHLHIVNQQFHPYMVCSRERQEVTEPVPCSSGSTGSTEESNQSSLSHSCELGNTPRLSSSRIKDNHKTTTSIASDDDDDHNVSQNDKKSAFERSTLRSVLTWFKCDDKRPDNNSHGGRESRNYSASCSVENSPKHLKY